jgi:hypothetical protein
VALNKVARNIDADYSAIATNNVSHAFAQKTRAATNVQHAFTAGQSKLLDSLRSLRDRASGKLETLRTLDTELRAQQSGW